VAAGGVLFETPGQRLLEGAASHAEGSEHDLPGELGERLAGHIQDQLLRHFVAAAGVAPFRTGDDIDANGRGVGGLPAVEHLDQGGGRFTGGVTGEAMNGEAGAVVEQPPQRNLPGAGELVLRDFPGAQLAIDVFVERKLSFVHQVERDERSDVFTDGRRLEERLGIHGLAVFGGRDAVAARSCQFAAVDDCDAGTGNVLGGHARGDLLVEIGGRSDRGGEEKNTGKHERRIQHWGSGFGVRGWG
jgi:hypothetical protein